MSLVVLLILRWCSRRLSRSIFFFCSEPPPTGISTLSLHDALPIYTDPAAHGLTVVPGSFHFSLDVRAYDPAILDRKSTRLNSSHVRISYAVFCLKKKTNAPRIRPATAIPIH